MVPQLPKLKMTALYFCMVELVELVSARWATMSVDQHAGEDVKQLQNEGTIHTSISLVCVNHPKLDRAYFQGEQRMNPIDAPL